MSNVGNSNAIDGTLSLTTRLRMQYQGFKIRVTIGLAFGAVAMVFLIVMKPPRPVAIPELGPDISLGFTDLVTWKLAEHDVPLVKFPRVLLTVADLQEQDRQAGMRLVYGAVDHYAKQYLKYLFAFLGGGLVAYLGAVISGTRETRLRTQDQYVRGAQILPIKELNRLTRKEGSRLNLAGVSVPEYHEITPWCFLGRPRVGKTVGIKSVLDQVMDIGKRILFDSKGDMIATHYRPGDLIFAPSVDQRSLKWTVFNDITSVSQISSIAAALIPEGTGNNKMWAIGAREVLEGLLLHAFSEGKTTNKDLWDLCCLDPEKMHAVLDSTPGAERAAGMLSNPKSNTAYSFYVSLIAFLKPIQMLAKMDGPFCIKQWLDSGASNSIFIVSTPEHKEALKPVMCLFLSMLINSHLSMPDDLNRRIWYFLDEFTILPKIEKLADAINFGPSKGLVIILGFQALHLVDSIYGRDTREAIWSAIGTHVYYSVGSKSTLVEMVGVVGEQEVQEHRNTMSIGITDSRDGTSSMEQLTKRTLVMPEEIRDMLPLSAILKILGYPAAKIKFTYKPYLAVTASLIPDPSFNIDQFIRDLMELKKKAEAIAPGGSEELEIKALTAEETKAMEAGGELSEGW